VDNLVYLRNFLPGYEYGPAISIVRISQHYIDSTVTRGNDTGHRFITILDSSFWENE